jgi:hypothetical protein
VSSELTRAIVEFRRAFELLALPAPREVVLEDAAFDRFFEECEVRCTVDVEQRSARVAVEARLGPSGHFDRFRVYGVEIVRHRPGR